MRFAAILALAVAASALRIMQTDDDAAMEKPEGGMKGNKTMGDGSGKNGTRSGKKCKGKGGKKNATTTEEA